MHAVEKRHDDAGFGQAHAQNRGAEFERDDGLLLYVVPDDQLRWVSAESAEETLRDETLFWGNLGFLPPPTRAR